MWIGFQFVRSLSNAWCFPFNHNIVTYNVDLQCYVMLGWEYIVHPHLSPMCLVLVSLNIPWIMEWIESQMGSLSQVLLFLGFYLFHRERRLWNPLYKMESQLFVNPMKFLLHIPTQLESSKKIASQNVSSLITVGKTLMHTSWWHYNPVSLQTLKSSIKEVVNFSTHHQHLIKKCWKWD